MGLIDTIGVKLPFQRSADVQILRCDGLVRFNKKSLVYLHHGETDVRKYE